MTLEVSADLTTRLIRLVRVSLHPLALDDAEEMSAVLGAPELYTFIGGGPSTAQDLRERYARLLAGPPAGDALWLNWLIRLRADNLRFDDAIGMVQATVGGRRDGAELAWMVGLPWQRRGYAKEAASGAADFLRHAGIRRLTAFIAPGHAASAVVAAAAGLRPTEQVRDGEICWSWRDGG